MEACYFLFALLGLAAAFPANEAPQEDALLAPPGKKMIFAHALFRHGARAPTNLYPTSLNTMDDFVQEATELLQVGMQEQFNLGFKLRSRYISQHKLVSPRLRSKEVYIRSTGYNRTIASAQCNFLSFYFTGNVKGKDYPQSLLWPAYYTPVPIYTVDWSQEDFFNIYKCPRALELNALIPFTAEFPSFVAQYQPLFAILSQKSGITITNSSDYSNLNNAFKVCDAIICEHVAGLPLAPWAKNTLNQCKKYNGDFYANYFGVRSGSITNGINVREEARRTYTGKFIWEIIDRFQLKLDNHLNPALNQWINEQVYYVYSGHDTSLIQLSSVLGFDTIGFESDDKPETADAVTLELWVGEDNSTVVKVLHFHRDKPFPIDISKLIPGCENTAHGCSLQQFAAKAVPYKPIGSCEQFCQSSIYGPQN